MSIGSEETGATTISESIVSTVAERDNERYKPSYVARLINRSLSDEVYNNYPGVKALKKGHFVDDKLLFHSFNDANVSIKTQDGARVEYPSLTMPTYKS